MSIATMTLTETYNAISTNPFITGQSNTNECSVKLVIEELEETNPALAAHFRQALTADVRIVSHSGLIEVLADYNLYTVTNTDQMRKHRNQTCCCFKKRTTSAPAAPLVGDAE